MQLKWYGDLKTPEDKKKREQTILNCSEALDILAKICYNSIHNEQSISTVDYDSPSWSHKQADKNGYIRALKDIAKMCETHTKDH